MNNPARVFKSICLLLLSAVGMAQTQNGEQARQQGEDLQAYAQELIRVTAWPNALEEIGIITSSLGGYLLSFLIDERALQPESVTQQEQLHIRMMGNEGKAYWEARLCSEQLRSLMAEHRIQLVRAHIANPKRRATIVLSASCPEEEDSPGARHRF